MKSKLLTIITVVTLLFLALIGTAYATSKTVSTAAELEKALVDCDHANLGDYTIVVAPNSTIEGNFVVSQRAGTYVTIIGDGSTTVIKGQIKLNGHSASDDASVTIKDLIFDATGLSVDYMIGQNYTANGADSPRYPRNLTVDGCSFMGNSEVVAVKVAQNQGFVKIVDCTAEGMHSLLQATSSGVNPLTVDSCTVTNTTDGRGVSLGNAQNAIVKNCTFDVADDKYAVRTDLNSSGPTNVSITGNTFKGGQPIVVRKIASDHSHTLTVAGNTYSQLTVEESDKVITLEDNATLDMFTGEEQAISDKENTFKASATEPSAEPTTKPAPTPAPSSSPISTPVPTPPKSGDETNLLGWMLLSGLSFVGIICLGKKRLSKR